MKVDIKYKRANCKRNAKWQEVRVKIHDRDLWSADVTLSHVIHPLLVQFRKQEPRPSMSLYPEDFSYDDPNCEIISDQVKRKWCDILDRMIYSFYWLKTDSTFGPHGPAIHIDLDQAIRDGEYKDRFEAWQPVFEKWDKEIKEHEAKIKEGLRLFGEHFQSLWT